MTSFNHSTSDMLQMKNTSKWWFDIDGTFGYTKCRSNNSNEGVLIYKTSTGARNDRTTKFCRPSTEKLLHNLKQSILWSDLSMDNNYLIDTTLFEWYEHKIQPNSGLNPKRNGYLPIIIFFFF